MHNGTLDLITTIEDNVVILLISLKPQMKMINFQKQEHGYLMHTCSDKNFKRIK